MDDTVSRHCMSQERSDEFNLVLDCPTADEAK